MNVFRLVWILVLLLEFDLVMESMVGMVEGMFFRVWMLLLLF